MCACEVHPSDNQSAPALSCLAGCLDAEGCTHAAGASALPRHAELFASDIHGEYEAFAHMLLGASGLIRARIDEVFPNDPEQWRAELAALVRYPRERMNIACNGMPSGDADVDGDGGCIGGETVFFDDVLRALAALAQSFAHDWQVSNVVDMLPKEHACVMAEMLVRADGAFPQDRAYLNAAIAKAVETDEAGSLVVAFTELIRSLAIGRMHIVGDVYDRGPAPDLVVDLLSEQPSLDIQWGNHDVVWMGAALGQEGCIAHVVRNCARYGNLSILEDAYGIDLAPLSEFAMSAYAKDPCVAFGLKGSPDLSEDELALAVKVQKAMAIIQFKVEGALIEKHPEYGLDDRRLLHMIDYEAGMVELDGKVYELTDKVFPTVDPADPYTLTDAERCTMDALASAFAGSKRLQRHMRILLDRGGLYSISDGILALHACVPMNADGTLMEANLDGQVRCGRSLYDAMEAQVRAAFDGQSEEVRAQGRDMLWYLWLGPASPLFAKSKMATFELYLIAEKEARKEVKNAFYSLRDDEAAMGCIFVDFGMDPASSRLVCGHVPVKVKDGEDPIKCGGRVIAIDGGYSKAYQPTTGIAGFTLVRNAEGVFLDAHKPFCGTSEAVAACSDSPSERRVVGR